MLFAQFAMANTHLEVLIGALFFGQKFVIDVLHTESLQHPSHFDAILHIVGESFQRFQIFLRSSISHIGQMCFDLFDTFLIQLLAQNCKLLLQITCNLQKSTFHFHFPSDEEFYFLLFHLDFGRISYPYI